MFVPVSNITIGEYKRVKPVAVQVKKSIYEYVQKAVIKLPLSARIKINGEVITSSIETAKLIEEGMKVNIQLGYNGSLKTEFAGFVSRVNFTSPCEVMCEGYSYQLRKKTYSQVFKNAELKEVLLFLAAGTDIVIDKDVPGFKIEKLALQNHNGTEALEMIKKISDNTIRMYFSNNTLYAGLQFSKTIAEVKYRLGWNTIQDSELKLRQAKNQDVTINYIGEKKDGTTVHANAGKTGEVKSIKTHAVTDKEALQLMADAKHSSMSYDGYEGKLTTFLNPYCEPGYKAVITDEKYKERSGNYFIDAIEINFGTSGARRKVGIAFKL